MNVESSLWMVKGAEFLVYLGSMFGVNKWMNSSLNRRVAEIEENKKEQPKRTIEDCRDLMISCPTKNQIVGLSEWLRRVEDKLDKVIMNRK